MFKLITTTFILFIIFSSYSQSNSVPSIDKALKKYGFIQDVIILDNDTSIYFLKEYSKKPENLVVFIQGTDPNPIFSYSVNKDEVSYYRWFSEDYKRLDSTFTYAIIPKPGMEGLFNDDSLIVPDEYYENNYLDYRVKQIDLSIDHIRKNHLESPNKIIVYGHSEGAAIAAALGSENDYVSHLGFWSGNVLNNFYEFSLFNRIESLSGKMSDHDAHENILGILGWYRSVIENPNSVELDHFGYTNKRWYSYEKAPIDYLVKIDIPIYALFATEDESTPIETAYLLPIKFIEKRKDNLTFEVCLGCDHSYQKKEDKNKISLWNEQFDRFIEWAINN